MRSILVCTVLGWLLALPLCLACGPGDGALSDGARRLPPTAVPTARRDAEWVRRNAEIAALPERGSIELVLLGDSLTQRWESSGRYVWNQRYGDRHAANFGINGDRTENVLWRIENGGFDGMRPKLVVLLIGTNNTPHDTDDDIVSGVRAIVQALRARMPDTRILLLGLFPKNPSAVSPVRARLAAINRGLARLAAPPDVTFLDIGQVFAEPDGSLSPEIMPDALHLSAPGYTLWADAMEPTLAGLLAGAPAERRMAPGADD